MISNLQSLRAFAALIVVMFHLLKNGPRDIEGTLLYDFFVNWGAAGVDLFFVLSGFIMVYSQEKKHRTAREFIIGRIIRIIPLYWFITLGWFLILFAFTGEMTTTRLRHVMASVAFLAQPSGFKYPFIVPGWTLEYEALFYLFFAMSLFIFRKKYYAPLILSLGVLSVSGLATPMVAEFLLGMIAAKLYQSKPARTFAPLTLAMGVLAFMLTAIFNITDAEDFSRSWVRVALWGIPSFLIIASIVNIKQLNFRVSTFLGDASYSIYLCHGICIFLYTQIEKFFFSEVAIGDLTSVSLCFAFSVGIGCVCYTLFEVPVTGSLRNFVKKRNFAVPDFRQHTRNELR